MSASIQMFRYMPHVLCFLVLAHHCQYLSVFIGCIEGSSRLVVVVECVGLSIFDK